MSDIYEMMLDSSKPYITIDKRTGSLVRLFNQPKQVQQKIQKNDIIQITFLKDGQTVADKMSVLEIINENTVVVESSFSNPELLPEIIFDFKFYKISGMKVSSSLIIPHCDIFLRF